MKSFVSMHIKELFDSKFYKWEQELNPDQSISALCLGICPLTEIDSLSCEDSKFTPKNFAWI